MMFHSTKMRINAYDFAAEMCPPLSLTDAACSSQAEEDGAQVDSIVWCTCIEEDQLFYAVLVLMDISHASFCVSSI